MVLRFLLPIYNNVYASRNYPVDVTDARNLIAARHLGNELLLKSEDDDQPLYFAVTSMDGYGIESGATQENSRDFSKKLTTWGAARMLRCDAKNVHLPEIAKSWIQTSFWSKPCKVRLWNTL